MFASAGDGMYHNPGMGLTMNAKMSASRQNWFFIVSGLSAIVLGVIFLMGLLSLIITSFYAGLLPDWLLAFQNNWLGLLFKLNAGFEGIEFAQLVGLNPLDITILALVIVLCLGLYAALRHISRVWSLVAALVPILGMLIFIVTKLAGRSGVMAAVLIISCIMLRSKNFARAIALVGILASLLLLVGDTTTSSASHSSIVASLVGAGYLFLMVWCFLVARRLILIGKGNLKE